MAAAFHSLLATLQGFSMADTYSLQVAVVRYIDVKKVLTFQNGLAIMSGLFTISPWLISFTVSEVNKELSNKIKVFCSYGGIAMQILSWTRWLLPDEFHPIFYKLLMVLWVILILNSCRDGLGKAYNWAMDLSGLLTPKKF